MNFWKMLPAGLIIIGLITIAFAIGALMGWAWGLLVIGIFSVFIGFFGFTVVP